MITEGLNFAGAALYSLPWYFVIPILSSIVLFVVSRLLASRLGAEKFWFSRILFTLFYIVFSFAGALLMFLEDDPSTATLFWVALVFYGLLVLNPTSEIISIFRRRIYAPRRWPVKIGWFAFNFSLLFIAFYAWFIEPYDIEVTHHSLRIPGSPDLRIVHISDIQAEYPTRREKMAAGIVNSLKPDIILITGDAYTGKREIQVAGASAAEDLIKGLRAPLGIFAISGSSNPAAEDMSFFNDAGAEHLSNRSVTVKKEGRELVIAGLDYLNPQLDITLQEYEQSPVILLYHSPSIVFSITGGPHRWSEALPSHFSPPPAINTRLAELGVDLVLTGHTHGGQVCLPFFGAIMTGTSLSNDFVQGLHDFGQFQLYINRGLGLDGRFAPKIRFLAQPEIAVFDITG